MSMSGRQGPHWLTWQVFGITFDTCKEIYSSRSPVDKRLAAQQIPDKTFYFIVQCREYTLPQLLGRMRKVGSCAARSSETVEEFLFCCQNRSSEKTSWGSGNAFMFLHYHSNHLCFQAFNTNSALFN